MLIFDRSEFNRRVNPFCVKHNTWRRLVVREPGAGAQRTQMSLEDTSSY